MEKTRKMFREILNKEDIENREQKRKSGAREMYKNGKYEQRKRAYGDYLYFQDREKFEFYYQEFLTK